MKVLALVLRPGDVIEYGGARRTVKRVAERVSGTASHPTIIVTFTDGGKRELPAASVHQLIPNR